MYDTTSQTIRQAIPRAGVSFAGLRPKATSLRQIGRKPGLSRFYDIV
jgi:hypothetical protein